VIAFIIVAAVIYYLVVVPMNRLAGLMRKPTVPPAPTTRKCPECLSEIPLAATRCAYCTSQVTPVATPN